MEANGEANGGASGGANSAEQRALRGLLRLALLALLGPLPVVLLLALWTRPRPAPPGELPPLILDAEEVAEQSALDEAQSFRAPEGPLVDRLRELLRQERGRAARAAPADDPRPHRPAAEARARIASAVENVESVYGEYALEQLRADDALAMRPALLGYVPEPERSAALGRLPALLARLGALDPRAQGEARLRAPWVVLTAFYKARWNGLVGLEEEEGLSPLEVRARQGWIALHAEALPLAERLEALERYAEVGGAEVGGAEASGAEASGAHVVEARMLLLLRAGRRREAWAAGQALPGVPPFWLRNAHLSAR